MSNTNQRLVGGKDKAMDNKNSNEGYSKVDMEMEMEIILMRICQVRKNCFFDHGNASYEAPKITLHLMTHLVFNTWLIKRTSLEYFSLKSHVHKKHILSTDSLSVSQSFVGGTLPPPPPPP